MQKMESMVSKHYMTVISIFDFYANLGGNNPYQMSLNAFSSCLEECQIPDNESPFTKKSDCDTLFIVAKSGSVEKGSKLDKVKDDNCLLRFEFIEVLIRIGVAKIGKVEQASVFTFNGFCWCGGAGIVIRGAALVPRCFNILFQGSS